MDDIIINEIIERYDANEINQRTKKTMKEIDEKNNKIFYDSLKVGMISGISTYGIIRVIQKFT